MDKITIESQSFEGIYFDGTLNQSVEILKAVKAFPHSVMTKANVEVDEELMDVVIHLYIVNGQLLYNPMGQPLNVVYYQIGKGETILFVGNIITVINHRLAPTFGMKVNGQHYDELDKMSRRETKAVNLDGENQVDDEDDFLNY